MIKLMPIVAALLLAVAGTAAGGGNMAQPEAKLFKYSTTVEKERPELSGETKKLIAAYRQNPTPENLEALRRQAEANYDKVVARKKAKLAELKENAKHRSKIQEMQEIVDEMARERDNRINQTVRRFTDERLRPNARKAEDGYLPILGAERIADIAYAPVTNEEYALFLQEMGRKAPLGWAGGTFPAGKEKHPATNVSYAEALAYCKWLTQKDGTALYRLPSEEEWELAAGHMPKDADMNCGENNGTTPVTAYAQTLSASGAVGMWGNVWEWTSTAREMPAGQQAMAVKGGAWDTPRTSCRTEYRGEGRNPSEGYDTVGFRMVRDRGAKRGI